MLDLASKGPSGPESGPCGGFPGQKMLQVTGQRPLARAVTRSDGINNN
jgi:hypothetical protein